MSIVKNILKKIGHVFITYPMLVSICFVLWCVSIVAIGREYFPENFEPQTTTFFENLYVVVIGLAIAICVIAVVLYLLKFIITELMNEVKELFKKKPRNKPSQMKDYEYPNV